MVLFFWSLFCLMLIYLSQLWLVFAQWSFLSDAFTFIVSLIPVSIKLQVWLIFCSYNLSSVFGACPVIFKSTLHVLPLGPSQLPSCWSMSQLISQFNLLCCFRLALCIFSSSLGSGFHAQLCRLSFLSSPYIWVPLVSNTFWLLTLVYSL